MRRLIERYRLARGLHWRDRLPSAADLGLDAHGVLYALLLAALLFSGQLLDQVNEHRETADRAAAQAELDRAALLACLNGGAPGLYIERNGVRHYLVCDGQPFTVTDENIRDKRHDRPA